ncbi:precorrin-4 C(11)-methyltransferase [Candidatus Synechococcus calcipolaris G9]|uniref:Precorrin-4 C(11)-methyltransferase n=1 Tax=Candidatus Synechococcus calcipolaris G9 TaxID=1497997 RepID=A0ABT6F3A6_9SYNE|nr:precorrin-4 C(11)-methyltransferase [Candidatus Synechococcus calcipolaris]MDG2992257.1 precorrin-4 C(11)-methyltransferase [Candidatus Synechococcus calcipolaris G9]
MLKPGVYFVGAGPGDPDLLTVKGQRLLSLADVVVYADSLVPHQILEMMRPDGELIPTASMTLEEILPILIERVQAGQAVVRLQSGDPSLYSAIHEQISLLHQADIPVEVVPGISAFQLAAARLQAELTIPELVQTIILTRSSGRTKVPPQEELASLAAHRASLCLYLSAHHVVKAEAQLLQHYPADTTIAICYRLGWPDEKIVLVPLAEMAATTRNEQLTRTTLYLISPALNAQPSSIESNRVRSHLYHPEHHHLFRP